MIEILIITLMGASLFLGTHYTLVLLDRLGLFDYSGQLGGDE